MKKIAAVSCLLLIGLAGFAQESKPAGKEYGAPGYEGDMQNFEAADKQKPPPAGAIVCIGSSSMRGWHGDIEKDLAPLTVIPRGFGGSNMNDALHYADRIVIPYKPRAVVVYEGDNDIASGISPEKIRDTFRAFVEKVRKPLPDVRIYFLSIKPSHARWNLWPQMEEANRLISNLCSQDKQLIYVDVASPMLGPDKKLKKDIFGGDGLHMNRAGYEIWRDTLKPVLLRKELSFEPKKEKDLSEKPKKEAAAPVPEKTKKEEPAVKTPPADGK